MNDNPTDSTRTGGTNAKIQSFLEALRNSHGRNSNHDGENRGFNPFGELQAKKEIEKKRAEQFHLARQQEWNKLFSFSEKRTQQKIEEIRQQLQQLTKQLKNLDVNITKAIESPITSGAGEYNEGFFQHLHARIRLITMNAHDTNNWLQEYNSRSKKKGYYLGMAKSKGTSYTQNNERAVATSVG